MSTLAVAQPSPAEYLKLLDSAISQPLRTVSPGSCGTTALELEAKASEDAVRELIVEELEQLLEGYLVAITDPQDRRKILESLIQPLGWVPGAFNADDLLFGSYLRGSLNAAYRSGELLSLLESAFETRSRGW